MVKLRYAVIDACAEISANRCVLDNCHSQQTSHLLGHQNHCYNEVRYFQAYVIFKRVSIHASQSRRCYILARSFKLFTDLMKSSVSLQ